MLSGFPYGRAQHVRGMPSSIVTVINYVSTRFFICHVMLGSTTCPFLVQSETYLLELPTGWFNKYHLLFSNYNSMFVRG